MKILKYLALIILTVPTIGLAFATVPWQRTGTSTAPLYINDNIGIATTTPFKSLTVSGEIYSSATTTSPCFTNTLGGTCISINGFITNSYASSTFLSFSYASSTYYFASNPSNYITNANGLFVNNSTDSTLTRSGAGPYTLGINLANSNTWTASTTFNATTTTNGELSILKGLWDSTGTNGSLGQLLQASGTSTLWTSTSSLGLVPTTRNINTTAPITGGGNLSADRTIACNVASGSQAGCLSSADWTTFNGKQATLSLPLSIANGGTATTTFQTGSVIFYNGTTLTEKNSNLFWDNTNNRLGIGTTTPDQTLTVYGNMDVSTGTNPALYVNTATSMVGIGTSTPGNTLVVNGTTNLFGTTNIGNSGVLNVGGVTTITAGRLWRGSVGSASAPSISFSNTNTTGIFLEPTSNFLGITVNSATSTTFDTSGRVGIGTTSPTAVLTVQASTTSSTANLLSVASTTYSAFTIDSKGHYITGGTTPGISGGTSSVVGNDNAGTITIVGTLLTSVTITFANAWASAPVCTESDNSTAVTGDVSSVSTTQVVFGFSSGLNSGTLWYHCEQ